MLHSLASLMEIQLLGGNNKQHNQPKNTTSTIKVQ